MDQTHWKMSVEKLLCLICAFNSLHPEWSIEDERRMQALWEVVCAALPQSHILQSPSKRTIMNMIVESPVRKRKWIRLKLHGLDGSPQKTFTLIDDFSTFNKRTNSLPSPVCSSILRAAANSEHHRVGNLSSSVDCGPSTYGLGALKASSIDGTGQPEPLYTPLGGNTWFRILIIEPGSFSEPLIGHLKPVLQSESVLQYEALSYCWTEHHLSRSPPRKICCNGHDVIIAPNLWLALCNIRLPSAKRVIWVDALCIDQKNLAERNEQVKAMASIYGNARQTLIWLGDIKPQYASRALSAVCQVVNVWDISHPASYWSKDGSEETKLTPIAECNTTDYDQTMPLHNIFDSNWFKRTWVIQEVVLARTAEVICPGSRIAWGWIGLASAILRTNYDHIIAMQPGRTGIYNAYMIFRLSKNHGLSSVDLSFLHLLRLTSRFHTTEPLDAIFALLGIKTRDNDPGKTPFVEVDYEISLNSLYRQVAEKCLEQDPPLSFLSNKQWDGDYENIYNKHESPSWIPRWGMRYLTSMLAPWSIDVSFNPAAGLPFKRLSSPRDTHLTIEGIHVSDVFLIGPRITEPFHIEEAVIWLLGLPAPGPLSQQHLEIYSRTLCGGRNYYGAPENDRAAFVPHFAAFILASAYPTDHCTSMQHLAQSGEPEAFSRTAGNVCSDRRLFITVSGHLGLGPSDTLPGDRMSVLGGAVMPFILRAEETSFKLIGECFVDDIMHGEAVVAAANESMLDGLFNIEALMDVLYSRNSPDIVLETIIPQEQFDFPERGWDVIQEIKREIVRKARKGPTILRVSRIEIH